MNQNKDIRVTVRLTPEQYESIRNRAASAMMTPSAYIRAAAMRHKVTVIPGLKEISHELKGIGRNLNQLTLLAKAFATQAWPESEVLISTHIDAQSPLFKAVFVLQFLCPQVDLLFVDPQHQGQSGHRDTVARCKKYSLNGGRNINHRSTQQSFL